MLAIDQICVLTRIKCTLRRGQKILEILSDPVCRLQIGIVMPNRVSESINSQILRLHLHDFFKVRMLPVSVGRILIDTAPTWIEQIELGSERFSRHTVKSLVATFCLIQAKLDGIPVEKFLCRTPTAICVVITVDQGLAECILSAGSERGLSACNQRH